MILVGVKFKSSVKIYFFDPDNIELTRGDLVVAETERGLTVGRVIIPPKETTPPTPEVKKILRKVTEDDLDSLNKNFEDEKIAFKTCLQYIEKHSLPMKLISCEYTLDRNKLIFYFTADGRIDFRELVKDLARVFKTRIEMRQIGVRDAAKQCGGIASCGRELCCSSFLSGFNPISIKMIRVQFLPLNPSKLSGMCGRLLCCLSYEVANYLEDGDLYQKPASYLSSLDEPVDLDTLNKLDEKENGK
ncbi:MAG: stage 0 sporulation protein [Proteobacteria bacterium]|nr:stage 0 sporulation protein [Pseudomonadota bacterium]